MGKNAGEKTMNKTELLDKLARSGEERVLLGRVLDRAELSARRGIPTHTDFLSPAERVSVEALLAAWGRPRCLFWGGYEGAERTVCLFPAEWQEDEDARGEAPLCALRCRFAPGSGLGHRDFLGAVLGLGITREKIGDMLVGEESCDILLLEEQRLGIANAQRVCRMISEE